jgi:hypothetical protein
MRDRKRPSHPEIAMDTPAGAEARRAMGQAILDSQSKVYLTDGTALGQVYDHSPIVCDDGTPPPEASISEYRPTTRPGARAPHAWLSDGRSTLDLYGRGFTLVKIGAEAPDTGAFESAFATRHVPLSVVKLADPEIAKLYERRLVLVRPDGHVAWRGDNAPTDPLAVVDRIRGA